MLPQRHFSALLLILACIFVVTCPFDIKSKLSKVKNLFKTGKDSSKDAPRDESVDLSSFAAIDAIRDSVLQEMNDVDTFPLRLQDTTASGKFLGFGYDSRAFDISFNEVSAGVLNYTIIHRRDVHRAKFELMNLNITISGQWAVQKNGLLSSTFSSQASFAFAAKGVGVTVTGAFRRSFENVPEFMRSQANDENCKTELGKPKFSLTGSPGIKQKVAAYFSKRLSDKLATILSAQLCDKLTNALSQATQNLPEEHHEEIFQLIQGTTTSVFVLTWNVDANAPPSDLGDILKPQELNPDFYVFCLQEIVKLDPQNLVKDSVSKLLKHERRKPLKWTRAFAKVLGDAYYEVKSIEYLMMGIYLKVFAKQSLAKGIKNVVTSTVPVGDLVPKMSQKFNKRIGNKGAIALGLQIFSVNFLFFSAHLSAHEAEKYWRRRDQDFQKIMNDVFKERKQTKSKSTSDYDIIFFAGDTNYRLNADAEFDRTVLQDLLQEENYAEIMKHDQLLESRTTRANDTFAGFNEGTITFPPTFKISKNATDAIPQYDTLRFPSYCDRILWRVNKVNASIDQRFYSSTQAYRISDHMPVYAFHVINVAKS